MECYLSCYLYTHPDKKQSMQARINLDKKTNEIKRENLVELIICTNDKEEPWTNTYSFHSYNVDLLSSLCQYLYIF